jgi:hypothetical protein
MKKREIREYLKTRLTDATEAQDRVFNTKGYLSDTQLPAINIVTPAESIAGNRQMIIRLEIHIFHSAENDEELGDRIDDLHEQVRAALFRFYQDIGEVDSRYIGMEWRPQMTAERPTVVQKVIYELESLDEE